MTGALSRLRARSAFAALARPGDPASDLLFGGAASWLLLTDADGTCVRAAPALHLAAGAPFASVLHPDDRAAVSEALAPVLSAWIASADIGSARLADGRPVSAMATSLRDRRGRAEGMLLAFADLAPLRESEARLAGSRRMEAAGRLAAGVAHDFNNLLTVIAAASGGLRARPDLDGAARADAALIADAAERGAALARRLLALGAPDAPPEPLALNAAVSSLAALLRRLTGPRVRIELELEEPGRGVAIAPAELDQVLMNLILNARDAMPDGGRILVRTGRATLLRPLSGPGGEAPAGRYALAEVIDEGAGVAPDAMPRLFEPYFTTRASQGGNGIGLSAVRDILCARGGCVAAESAPGRTVFRVYLPSREPPAPAPPPDPPRAPAGRTVLLADDEEPVRRLAARTLAARGWIVIEADSAESALALEPSVLARIDAVVADMAMPGMDGPALVARLRAERPRLPAVIVSGYATLPGEGMRFLAKPYSLDALSLALEQAVAASLNS